MSSESHLIQIDHLCKSFDANGQSLPVLDDLTLNFAKGTITAILGPSGSGKTTILNILSGTLAADSGTVDLDESLRSALGYVFQRDRLLPWRTVLENATLGLEIKKVPRTEAEARARLLLSEFGLGDFEKQYPDVLSEGMRQRVSLCRTLLTEPTLLLLDEPFSALDLEARLRLQERIKKYTVENQAITVLVTHDLQEAVSMADCLVLLSARPAHVRTVWKPAFSSMESTALQHDAGFKQFVETVATEIISTHA